MRVKAAARQRANAAFATPVKAWLTWLKWAHLLVGFGIMVFLLMFFYGGTLQPAVNGSQWVDVRFKGVVLTVLGGGMLAVAGVCLQKVTRNTLAEVNILGIGSINILMIFTFIVTFPEVFSSEGSNRLLLPLVTLMASLVGTGIVYGLSQTNRVNRNTFVVIGISLQFLFEALSVVLINPSQIRSGSKLNVWREVQNYTLGLIRTGADDVKGAVPWELIAIAASVSVAAVLAIVFLRRHIDIYSANEGVASSLGVRTGLLRAGIYFLVAVLAALQASIVGTVALLGIIAPGIARLLFGSSTRNMVPASFALGAIMVMVAQLVSLASGTLIAPGILATAVAAPYFIVMIIRNRGGD